MHAEGNIAREQWLTMEELLDFLEDFKDMPKDFTSEGSLQGKAPDGDLGDDQQCLPRRSNRLKLQQKQRPNARSSKALPYKRPSRGANQAHPKRILSEAELKGIGETLANQDDVGNLHDLDDFPELSNGPDCKPCASWPKHDNQY